MTDVDPEFLRQLQEAFVIEAREQLQSFMTSVIALEGASDDKQKHKLSEDILHDLHSMKGNSRAAGISAVETVCQALESALLSLRRKKELLHTEAADVFHAAIDLLDDLINKVESEQADYIPANFADTLLRLKLLDERQRLAMEFELAGSGPASSPWANQPAAATAQPGSHKPAAVTAQPGANQPAPATAPPSANQPAPATAPPSANQPAPATAPPSANQPAPATAPSSANQPAPATAPPSANQPAPATVPPSANQPAAAAGLPGATASAQPAFGTAAPPSANQTAQPASSTAPQLGPNQSVPQPMAPGSPQLAPPTNANASSTPAEAVAAKPEAASAGGAKQTRTQPGAGADKSVSTRIALWKLDKLLRESEEMLILKQISEQHLEDIRDMKVLSKQLSAESLRLENMLGGKKSKQRKELSEKEIALFAESLKTFCKDFEQSIIQKMRRQQTEQRLCFNMVDGFIDSVKSLLMQDFSTLLSLVPKVVRDLSRELRKDVDLEIFGSEIEIDRRILEEIKDPVIHLVRNSLDHGIETGEARLAKGKPPRALLRIGARQDESGNVQLIISDDGRGINAEKLKLVAVREGAITAEEAQHLTESEAIELMYRSSVSTSDTVTEISGRGIGMAIVRERIHELGGRVLVETNADKGTSFILQLPTKLSTFRGIQVLAGEQSFIIPTLHVHYAGRILRSEIKQSGSRNLVNVNGQLTSVQALTDVLQMASAREFRSRSARNYQQLLVLETGDRRAAFLVDEILHEHEVLVRGLSYPLVRVANIAGATILGSGQVVPVLNISDLLETSSKATWADEKLSKQLVDESARISRLSELPVFLVDRHLTSLVMLKSLLESEGYVVNTFDSNETALEGLDQDEPLILLKSSELPETPESGLAFWIRKDLRLKDLPIIFFGSDPASEGEAYSERVGGNAYFSKNDFDRKQILQLIERLT